MTWDDALKIASQMPNFIGLLIAILILVYAFRQMQNGELVTGRQHRELEKRYERLEAVHQDTIKSSEETIRGFERSVAMILDMTRKVHGESM